MEQHRSAKEILEHTRLLLLKNIVLTDDLRKHMVEKGVVTETTMNEIMVSIINSCYIFFKCILSLKYLSRWPSV